MPKKRIQKAFINGVQTIFTTLFNNGSENDGVYYYPLDTENSTINVYGEQKAKLYKDPLLLVCKATISPTKGEQDVEEVKNQAEFVVTLKSLVNNDLGVTDKDLEIMRRGIMKFKGVCYLIDNIVPKAYVEDVFLMYTFYCTEDKNIEV